MKGFQFRLESILALRKHREEAMQRELAGAQRALDRELAEMVKIETEIRSRMSARGRNHEPGPIDPGILSLEGSYIELLKRRLAAQRVRVEQQACLVSETRAGLLAASRDKKALETYRDKVMVSFTKEVARKEQATAEETAGVLHLLRRQEFDDA